MSSYYFVAAVTLVSGLVYFAMALAVARAHGKSGIQPPAMTGDPMLERTVRAHINTLEWMPIFLPSLWLFAIFWDPTWAAILGVIWIIGRILYFFGYVSAAEKRSAGFLIQFLAAFALLLGALGRIIYLAATNT
jgi:glutathione S-transferase